MTDLDSTKDRWRTVGRRCLYLCAAEDDQCLLWWSHEHSGEVSGRGGHSG